MERALLGKKHAFGRVRVQKRERVGRDERADAADVLDQAGKLFAAVLCGILQLVGVAGVIALEPDGHAVDFNGLPRCPTCPPRARIAGARAFYSIAAVRELSLWCENGGLPENENKPEAAWGLAGGARPVAEGGRIPLPGPKTGPRLIKRAGGGGGTAHSQRPALVGHAGRVHRTENSPLRQGQT